MVYRVLLFILLSLYVNTADLVHCESEGPFYFKFLPKRVGVLQLNKKSVIKAHCFQNVEFGLSETEEAFEAVIMARDKKNWHCSDMFLITNVKSSTAHVAFISGSYKSKLRKSDMSNAEIEYIRANGLPMLMSCAELKDWPKSLWMSIKTVLGGIGTNPYIPIFGSKNPEYQIEANREWVKGWTGYEHPRRDDTLVNIDKNTIKSGTFVGIYRFDGLDNMINVATGSRLGHTAITLWHDGELYVCESEDAWYWPNKGIQKTKWEDWVKSAHTGDYSVMLLPLNDEHQAKFNEKKAWDWFEQVAGLDYGFRNFVFAYTDTLSENFPEFVDANFLMMAAKIYEKIMPSHVKLFFIEAFNKRLQINASNIDEVTEELFKQNMSYAQLMTMVEKEGWQYSNGFNYVCSAFVTSVYKRAGLFGDLEINVTEFVPKDVYELNFFDTTGNKVAKGCENSASFGYCQIMGKILLDLGEINYIQPYANMAETCPTVAPDFKHRDGC